MSVSFEPRAAPVKEGDEVEVLIEGVGEKGDGIARVQGFVIFVPGAQQGQQVTVRMVKVLSKVGFAEVVKGKPVKAAAPSKPAKSSPKKEKPAEKPQEKEITLPDPDPDPKDSEDFGEEPEEDEYM